MHLKFNTNGDRSNSIISSISGQSLTDREGSPCLDSGRRDSIEKLDANQFMATIKETPSQDFHSEMNSASLLQVNVPGQSVQSVGSSSTSFSRKMLGPTIHDLSPARRYNLRTVFVYIGLYFLKFCLM